MIERRWQGSGEECVLLLPHWKQYPWESVVLKALLSRKYVVGEHLWSEEILASDPVVTRQRLLEAARAVAEDLAGFKRAHIVAASVSTVPILATLSRLRSVQSIFLLAPGPKPWDLVWHAPETASLRLAYEEAGYTRDLLAQSWQDLSLSAGDLSGKRIFLGIAKGDLAREYYDPWELERNLKCAGAIVQSEVYPYSHAGTIARAYAIPDFLRALA